MWSGFFDPPAVLAALGLNERCGRAVDFGCGYGTFSIAAARVVRGPVHALDIEPAMVVATAAKAAAAGLANVHARRRDFMVEGSGLPDASVGYAMLFNILHAEQPMVLVREAARVLEPGGVLAIMHWRCDVPTPRGPSLDIRPRPEQCGEWGEEAGLTIVGAGSVELPPYHYGLAMRKG